MPALSCGEERAHRILGLMDHQSLVVVVRNTPGRTVVSGPSASVRTAAKVARAVELRPPRPFHNPLLTLARYAFARAAREYEVYPLCAPVHSPVPQRWHRDGDDLANVLALHLPATPLAFDTAPARLYGQGVRGFAELGADVTLGGLLRDTHPECAVLQPLAARDEYRARVDAVTYLTGERFGEAPVVRQAAAPEAPSPASTWPAVEAQPERPRALEPSGTPAGSPPPGDREGVFGRICASCGTYVYLRTGWSSVLPPRPDTWQTAASATGCGRSDCDSRITPVPRRPT
ncbi:hypothetical protein [Streptomyces sp. NPDC047061]|uniref:hypothetical protein n=1 Tax=Streptomyces sp. NPDC047061 TaxID=3154605 RepID=UPI0033CAE847